MLRVIEWGVANSLTVAALAPVVFAIGRLSRQPALRHALWILLLLKLVTPPLVSIDLPTEWIASARPSNAPAVPVASNLRSATPGLPVESDRRSAIAPGQPSPGPSPAAADPISLPLLPTAPLSIHRLEAPRAISETFAGSETLPRTTVPTVGEPSAVPLHEPARRSLSSHESDRSRARAEMWAPVIRALLVVWGMGSLLFFAIQAVRLMLFARRLRRSSYASPALQAEKDLITAGLGRTVSPPALMVNGVVSPMLWGLGPWCRILFPAELHRQLTPEARRTLLLHELAHYYRGDHWVRVLEIVAANLFWWHPAVWWSLREIESSEEECCDHWVMRRTTETPRCYAEALLDTIDFLCEQNPLAPPIASGLGNPRELRGRLVRIMDGGRTGTITLAGRAVVGLVLVALPIQPQALAAWTLSVRDALQQPRIATPRLVATPVNPAASRATHNTSSELGTQTAATRSRGPSPNSRLSAPLTLPSDWAKAVSADDRFEIRARSGRRVELFDRQTGTSTALTPWNVAAVAFLPSGDRFVSGGFDRQVRLWSAGTGQVLAHFEEGSDAVQSIAAAPDGTTIASGTRSGEVFLDDVESQHRTARWTFDAPINSVRFAPDGGSLLVSIGAWHQGSGGELARIDLTTQQIDRRIPLDRPAGVAAFAEEPNVVVTGGWDGRQTYLDLATGAIVGRTTVSKDLISAAAFSTDTRVFPAGTLDEARAEQTRFDHAAQARRLAALRARLLPPGAPVPQWLVTLPEEKPAP